MEKRTNTSRRKSGSCQISHKSANCAGNTFIDLFAGCGGLSLGLLNAGWKGLLAIEENPDAFKTLSHNLVDKGQHNRRISLINWPQWLEKKPLEISDFISNYRGRLRELRGSVQLVAGGPPCQGFSFVGKRNENDPRNELFKHHMEIVNLVKPKVVLLENVRGIDAVFSPKKSIKKKYGSRLGKSYANRIKNILGKQGYHVQQEIVVAADFGVPQLRPRHFTLGISRDLFTEHEIPNFFEVLRENRRNFLRTHGLSTRRPVSVKEAISDLTTDGKKLVDCEDSESRLGFKQITYDKPNSKYQKLMHGTLNGSAINSLRLVNHRPETVLRFNEILRTCRKGVQLSEGDKQRLGIKKIITIPLAPDMPSCTLTTLPDDLIHYSEPRIHTVREHARLQSFPDWFEFRGKYTTGGDRRVRECPRYTQVGNAVPPLLAEAIGKTLIDFLEKSNYLLNSKKSSQNTCQTQGRQS